MERTIEKQPDLGRYIVREGADLIGLADYAIVGNAIAFTHTEVIPEKRGTGAAAALVQFAMDDVRDNTELRVVPRCSYVAIWLRRHEEYQPLLTRGTTRSS